MLHTTTDDIIPSQTSEESDQQSSSQLSSVSTNSANSPTSLSRSQITSNDIERPPNSQLSDLSTITLSSPSQTVDISQESKQVAEKESQTADGVFLEKDEYEALVNISRTLQQFGITKEGLESLQNLGIAAHPQTVKFLTKSSSSTHSSSVLTFIESGIEKNQFIIFCIDDYHNIHTQHRPEGKTQAQAIHMTTLLLNVFPNVKAVQHHGSK